MTARCSEMDVKGWVFLLVGGVCGGRDRDPLHAGGPWLLHQGCEQREAEGRHHPHHAGGRHRDRRVHRVTVAGGRHRDRRVTVCEETLGHMLLSQCLTRTCINNSNSVSKLQIESEFVNISLSSWISDWMQWKCCCSYFSSRMRLELRLASCRGQPKLCWKESKMSSFYSFDTPVQFPGVHSCTKGLQNNLKATRSFWRKTNEKMPKFQSMPLAYTVMQ